MSETINSSQRQRDAQGLRNVCAADGRRATDADPLGVSDDGFRVHVSHFADPDDGFYGKEQKG